MIATGGTGRAAINMLKDWGVERIKYVCICASRKGIEALAREFPTVQLYVGVIDDDMNSKGYIVPGIGDSGDRLFKTPHD